MFLSTTVIRSFSSSGALFKPVKNVTIIGSGLMGSGIAQVSAQSKLNVTLVDQNDQILQKAQNAIDKSLRRVGKKKFPDDENVNNFKIIKNILLISGPKSVCLGHTQKHQIVGKSFGSRQKCRFGD